MLPQRDPPPASWIEMIAKGNKQQAQDIQKAYAHTIGNLTLTGYNPRLGDKPFPEKRDKKDAKGNFIGFKNGLFLNKYLQAQTTWNKEKIKKRSDYLIDKLMKLFG